MISRRQKIRVNLIKKYIVNNCIHSVLYNLQYKVYGINIMFTERRTQTTFLPQYRIAK